MQIVNQIGYLQHWGFSPAQNVLKDYKQCTKQIQKEQKPLRILLSGCCDIRHIMKTLCDISAEKRQFKKIEFYFHENKIELLARMLLLIHIIHEQNLNYEERTELFLDIYGNTMIKERNARYLHLLKEDMLNFIHSENKVRTVLKHVVDLKHLKFEERDQMSEFMQSWSISAKSEFAMAELREQRLRALFKERYDFRANLIDWDYNMLLLPCAEIVHFYHYKEWRLSGLAFEQRFSTYCEPNRTLASYIPGKRKDTKTSCLVRGYWGDIVMSPYVALGVRCQYAQKDLLFKKANQKNIGHSVELSIYNMTYWLYQLEENKEYVRVFRDFYRADKETQKELQKKSEEKKRKKDLLDKSENDPQPLEAIKEEGQQMQEKCKERAQDLEVKKGLNPSKKIPIKVKKKNDQGEQALDSDEEIQKAHTDEMNEREIELAKDEQPLLHGFEQYQTKIYPMAFSAQNIMKPKFHDFFDVVVLGFGHTAYLTKQRNVVQIVKKGGQILVERPTFLVPKKKDQRKQIDQKLEELTTSYKQLSKLAETDGFFTFQKANE